MHSLLNWRWFTYYASEFFTHCEQREYSPAVRRPVSNLRVLYLGGLLLTQRTSPRNVHMPVGFRRAPAVPRSDQERLANDCFLTKQYQRCVQYLTLAIAVDGHNPSLYAKRAAAKAHLGLFSEARGDAERAVDLDPASSKARFRLKTLNEYIASLKSAPAGWDGEQALFLCRRVCGSHCVSLSLCHD